MSLFLATAGFLLSGYALLALYHTVVELAKRFSGPEARPAPPVEAMQSIISGTWILVAGTVLALIYRPLVVVSIMGIAIVCSGIRAVRSGSEQDGVWDVVKDLKTGLWIVSFGAFCIVLAHFAGREKPMPVVAVSSGPAAVTPAEQPAVSPPASPSSVKAGQQEQKPASGPAVSHSTRGSRKGRPAATRGRRGKNSSSRTVKRIGYVRSGPSKRYRIMGTSIKGSTIVILRSKNGYYRARGRYTPGRSGRGRRRSGIFWIGTALVN